MKVINWKAPLVVVGTPSRSTNKKRGQSPIFLQNWLTQLTQIWFINPTIFNIIRWVCWVDETNNSTTKRLMFQALIFFLLTKLSQFTKLQLHISTFKIVLDEKSYIEWKQIPFCEIAQFCQKGIQQWFLFQPDSELKSESSESFNFLEKSRPNTLVKYFCLDFFSTV